MDDEQIISGLNLREETAFRFLIDRYHASMVRIAMLYMSDRAMAEEIAQETWLKVLEGIDRFERRSTLKTWIFCDPEQPGENARETRRPLYPFLGARSA